MKFAFRKCLFFTICVAVLSISAEASLIAAERNEYAGTDREQAAVAGGAVSALLPPAVVTERLRDEILRMPARAAGSAVLSEMQTAGRGMETLIAAGVGFFCITFVRDRRVWAAIAYALLIHPAAIEAQHLERLMKTAQPCSVYAKAFSSAATGGDVFQSRFGFMTAAVYRSAQGGSSEPYQTINIDININSFFKEAHQALSGMDFVQRFSSSRQFIPNICSRPPPA